MLCADLNHVQAAVQLILTVAKSPLFGCIAYRVKVENRPFQCLFSRDCVKVVSDQNKVLYAPSYLEVANVVVTPSAFKLMFGNIMAPMEVVMTTYLSNEMKAVFNRFAFRYNKK